MKRKRRKYFAWFLCMVILAVSPMPVSAATTSCSNHVLSIVKDSDKITGYVNIGGETHDELHTHQLTCSKCGATMDGSYTVTQSHSWYRYIDMGHKGTGLDGEHVYKIECRQCLYQKTITLICTGKLHSVPW